MTDKQIIIAYLKLLREQGDGWILGGKVRSIQTPFGWIGFRGDRDCRELVRKGVLEKRMNGKYAEIRYKKDESKQVAEALRPVQEAVNRIQNQIQDNRQRTLMPLFGTVDRDEKLT